MRESLERCVGEDRMQEFMVEVPDALEIEDESRPCIAFEQFNDANVAQRWSDHGCIHQRAQAIYHDMPPSSFIASGWICGGLWDVVAR